MSIQYTDRVTFEKRIMLTAWLEAKNLYNEQAFELFDYSYDRDWNSCFSNQQVDAIIFKQGYRVRLKPF